MIKVRIEKKPKFKIAGRKVWIFVDYYYEIMIK